MKFQSGQPFVFFLVLITALTLVRCVPPEKEVDRDTDFQLDDPIVRQIFQYQDKRLSDSLIAFFSHKDPAYRFLAVRAFGSIQDSMVLDTLIGMLNDPVSEVREAAAFALGQTGIGAAEEYLVRAFERGDTTGYYFTANAAIMEAIGKCGGPRYLNALATISSYTPEDTVLLLGQSRGIYQYGLRGITLTEATERMAAYAIDDAIPAPVRLIATHYLARTRNIGYAKFVPDLILRLRKEDDPNIRMVLATAIGKSREEAGKNAIMELFPEEPDHRVRCNMIKALQQYPSGSVKELMFIALRDPHPMVAQMAAEHFLEKGSEADALQYRQLARDTFHWIVSAKLFQAANRHIPYFYTITKNNLRFEITRALKSAVNDHHKAALVRALGEDPRNYNMLIEEAGDKNNAAVVRTSAAETLQAILFSPELNNVFREGRNNVEDQIIDFFKSAAISGEAGLAAVAGGVFQDKRTSGATTNWEFLKSGLDSLNMPNDLESYRELQKAYSARTGKEEPIYELGDNHPIPWATLNRISESTEAVIRTNKGQIAIRFYPGIAPGSVANFIQLAQQGFYDEKTFHRIVPNFVSQGGCPRGDGYGSMDYTIRSEFGKLHYDAPGWVGMASAGKDTEGTQFFITHSPTPHLDGKYTIFGRVYKGMETVHQLMPGDTIKSVILNGLL